MSDSSAGSPGLSAEGLEEGVEREHSWRTMLMLVTGMTLLELLAHLAVNEPEQHVVDELLRRTGRRARCTALRLVLLLGRDKQPSPQRRRTQRS